MSDPQLNRVQAIKQQLDAFITDSGIKLKLDLNDSRLEELKSYQHWTLIDLDALAGITEFSDIMCAYEWLEKMLQVELDDLTKVLCRYDLEHLTVNQLLVYVGVPSELLLGARATRTIADFCQTAFNDFRLEKSYQDDSLGTKVSALRVFAKSHHLKLVEPQEVLQAALILRATLTAKGYQSAVLNINLTGAVGTGTQTFQIVQTPTTLSVKVPPKAQRSTVLKLTDEDYKENYVCGLDAYQMQALTDALKERTQDLLADRNAAHSKRCV